MLVGFACCLSMAISLLPIVDYYCSWYITVIPVILVLFATLRMNSNIYPLLVAFSAILAFAFLEYWIVYRSSAVGNYILNFVIAFLPAIIAMQVGEMKGLDGKRFFANCLQVAMIFSGITSITTIIGLNQYPMASRELASGTAIYDTLKYSRINIGGYEYIYSLVLLIPIAIWMIRHSKGFMKALNIAVLVLNILCIYESQYTLALICTVLAFLVVLMQKHRKLALIILAVLIAMLAINGFALLGDLFEWASEVVNQEYVSDRLLQVSQLLSGETVNTETNDERIQHYLNELQSFADSPIWGHNLFSYNSDRISGHSVVLDMLGGAGILGLTLLIVLVCTLYKFVFKTGRLTIPGAVKETWIILAVVSCVNPVLFPLVTTIVFFFAKCIQKIEN